jgi:hypothetical protein
MAGQVRKLLVVERRQYPHLAQGRNTDATAGLLGHGTFPMALIVHTLTDLGRQGEPEMTGEKSP